MTQHIHAFFVGGRLVAPGFRYEIFPVQSGKLMRYSGAATAVWVYAPVKK